MKPVCAYARTFKPALVAAAFTLPFSASYGLEVIDLPPLTVISQPGAVPLMTEIDPKAPAQPIPAQDGAEILRTIPGFNVIRKGGTDGDPVIRGMAGSRLGILLNGENILGGCGNRMDPPTAYVFPSSYDAVTVLKGPQSVLYGPGNSAGVVLFERNPQYYSEATFGANAALTLGSWDRNDQFIDLRAGNSLGYVQVTGNRTASGDYKDGAGRRVHSQYERWSLQSTVGWTPDAETALELTTTLSDGEAAYADRMMDGSKFARRHLGLRFRRSGLAGIVESVDANVFVNDVDHVMDNYSLREFNPTMMMPNPMASNPDRLTWGGRVNTHLDVDALERLVIGSDYQANRHRTRRSMNEPMNSYRNSPRVEDAEFEVGGLYGELTRSLAQRKRILAGARLDFWQAKDLRESVSIGMMGSEPNPTAGQRRRDTLPSAFVRYEQEVAHGLTAFAGLGHAQRFPDYWELFNKEAEDGLSAFQSAAEKTTQVDLGLTYQSSQLAVSLSAFVGRIDDYLLIESSFAKPAGMMGSRDATVTRNVDATTLGGELSLVYRFAEHWQVDGSVASVRGRNRSDGLPLAQQPPLEGKLGLTYSEGRFSVGGLLRAVSAQDRVAINQGNIVGQDLGRSPGFAVFALNASWAFSANSRLVGGVDNLFDREYAEHLSRGGSMVAGFPPPTTRINEPGRTAWLKWDLRF
ncbi:MAG: TonB-dependent copper receptor [Opitutales bacterium]|nr:TonB-dependent copper receptor [Opitutales bacterium]